ncbi:uncharacterized protein LOC110452355 [Mizuhopecten yessoensis]|uniref:Uncharacterized protein n=1 Tax=Mizuhopecten yessoensis TaxID=6573 RepID=A0A210QJP7_MIZYE|nr:uncharacterized protein LOC110452355 [Mizuhopecten yessoensis]OWF48988.1 hypothetical protein KP79_PYT06975 [Mizuhopecten yessoensis]
MAQGNSSSKQIVVTNRRKNPSQQAELEAITSPRQTLGKKPHPSRFEGGVQISLETSETLISAKKSSKKKSKNSKKGENSKAKDRETLKNVKDSSANENVIPKDKFSSPVKLIPRPGSEDSVSSSMRQERERLSSRKESSFSTYIEITHNASQDLIVVENADSDWSDSVELIPEVENVEPLKTAKPEVDKLTGENEAKPRTKKRRDEKGRLRSNSANDKDELEDRAKHVILIDLETITQEVHAEPIYVPYDIWEPKRRTRKKGKQTMVRVGGGFMDLPYYLHYHVPIKVYQLKPYAQLFNKHMLMIKSKRPESATDHKQYDRPSWTTMNKGFKAFARI